jgi:general secretion pathway protein G
MSPDPILRDEPRRHAKPDGAREPSGFTMLEILIVVTIIGALMAIVANRFLDRQVDAKISLAHTQMRQLEQALELYRLDNGRYPTTEQGLRALVRQPISEPAPRRYPPGAYLSAKLIRDPWEGEFQYTLPGAHNAHAFDLYSFGPDGLEGGETVNADIVNWDTGAID